MMQATVNALMCMSNKAVKWQIFILEKILDQNSFYMATLFLENENVIYFLDIFANRLGFCL